MKVVHIELSLKVFMASIVLCALHLPAQFVIRCPVQMRNFNLHGRC